MVTKHHHLHRNRPTCFVLAKKLMVTKHKANLLVDVTSFVLAKKLMVTKLVSIRI